MSGDVAKGANHFERLSLYFSGVDTALEADNRHECTTLFRYHGYRYKSLEALHTARNALQRNLGIWQSESHTEKWCRTKNALGGVSVRLAQFDIPENAMSHLNDAKEHYEGVRAVCSEAFLPKVFATAGVEQTCIPTVV